MLFENLQKMHNCSPLVHCDNGVFNVSSYKKEYLVHFFVIGGILYNVKLTEKRDSRVGESFRNSVFYFNTVHLFQHRLGGDHKEYDGSEGVDQIHWQTCCVSGENGIKIYVFA